MWCWCSACWSSHGCTFDVHPVSRCIVLHGGVVLAVYERLPLTLALLVVTPVVAPLIVCCSAWPPCTRDDRRGCVQPDGRRDVHAHLQAPIFLTDHSVAVPAPPPC